MCSQRSDRLRTRSRLPLLLLLLSADVDGADHRMLRVPPSLDRLPTNSSQSIDPCAIPSFSDGSIDCRQCLAKPSCSLMVATGHCVSTDRLAADSQSAVGHLVLDSTKVSFCENDVDAAKQNCTQRNTTMVCHGPNNCVWLPYCSSSFSPAPSPPMTTSVLKQQLLSVRVYVFAVMFVCVFSPVVYCLWHSVLKAREARRRIEQEELRMQRVEANPLRMKLTSWRQHREQQRDDLGLFKSKGKVSLQRLESCRTVSMTDSECHQHDEEQEEEDPENCQVPFWRLQEQHHDDHEESEEEDEDEEADERK